MNRDQRYRRSAKGRATEKRREAKPARVEYRREWLRAYRARKKSARPGRAGSGG